MRKSPRVFLSYVSSDTDVAETLRTRLAHFETAPFLDQVNLKPGEHILSSLRAQLAAADFLVFLLSPEALESPWVSQELEYAVSKDLRQRAITIVPVKIRPCRVPAFLASWTVIDATKNFDRAVQSLASLLEVAPLVQFDQLEPRVFEDFVGNLLKAYGFKKVKPALPSRDMGFDFAAETLQRDPFGRLETVDWLIEVKATKQQADTSSLRAFLGALSLRKERGLFITSGQLTTPAKEWLEDMGRKSGPKISVIEGTELKRLAISKPKVVHKYFKRAEEKQ